MNEHTITEHQVDLWQGEVAKGLDFGYVHGEDGGFFFTWHPTLEATLESVDEDDVDGDGGLVEEHVVEFLRTYLPTQHNAFEDVEYEGPEYIHRD